MLLDTANEKKAPAPPVWGGINELVHVSTPFAVGVSSAGF